MSTWSRSRSSRCVEAARSVMSRARVPGLALKSTGIRSGAPRAMASRTRCLLFMVRSRGPVAGRGLLGLGRARSTLLKKGTGTSRQGQTRGLALLPTEPVPFFNRVLRGDFLQRLPQSCIGVIQAGETSVGRWTHPFGSARLDFFHLSGARPVAAKRKKKTQKRRSSNEIQVRRAADGKSYELLSPSSVP